MGLTAVAGVAFSIFVTIALHLVTNAIPKLAKMAVTRAAKRLPNLIELEQQRAWLADLAVLDTDFEKLRCAVDCWITSFRIRMPFSLERSHSRLVAARIALKADGSIAWYAMRRLKAWGTSENPSDWSYSEKLCMALIFLSGETIEKNIKNYLRCLEEDIQNRPGVYPSKEVVANKLLMPVFREVKILQFLKENGLKISSCCSPSKLP